MPLKPPHQSTKHVRFTSFRIATVVRADTGYLGCTVRIGQEEERFNGVSEYIKYSGYDILPAFGYMTYLKYRQVDICS